MFFAFEVELNIITPPPTANITMRSAIFEKVVQNFEINNALDAAVVYSVRIEGDKGTIVAPSSVTVPANSKVTFFWTLTSP
jgi:hypothetical protein